MPVYPEQRIDIPRLSALYESLYSQGITVTNEGETARYVPTFKGAHGVELDELDPSAKIQPADYYVREAANLRRVQELVEAERVVAALEWQSTSFARS